MQVTENMTKKKMIITGGLGFLGSAIAKNFFHKYDLVIIDNESTNVIKADELSLLSDQIIYKKLDLALLNEQEKDWLKKELEDTTYFCHFAAAVGVKKIDENPNAAIINEYQVNQNILPLIAQSNAKLLFASSSEVYGNATECTEDQSLEIGSPDTLRWGYACNKLMTEFLIKSYEIPHITLRLFNVTGPGQSPDYGMVIPKMIKDAKEEGSINVYGDGNQCRSFCDVEDFLKAIDILISNDMFHNQTLNIGNDKNLITIKELAHLIRDTLKVDAQINYLNFHDVYSKNSDDIYKRSPDTAKLKEIYTPEIDVKSIIRKIAEHKYG